MALVKISMCSFLSANAPEVGLEHFCKWTFCTVVKKEWVSAVDQKQNSKRCSVRNFSNCYTWVNSHLMQGHAISFLFIYREGENATELQPGWNSISKRSVVGAGEFVSVSQMAGLDTKASPWPQEWLKLQTFFRSPWHVPKPWQGGATQGCCSGHSWASSRLALASNSCCSQQVLLFNSNGKFLPWFYYKVVIQALQSCSYSSF